MMTGSTPISIRCALLGIVAVASLAQPGYAGTESIRIGIQKLTTSGPVYIAEERGYFAEEGLDATLVDFEAAQPIAVAAVSGAIDFGVTGLTAGFYALAGQGELRIIGAWARDVPSFQLQAVVVSNRAYDASLTSLRDLPGHSVAITQIGSTFHYSLGLLAEKYGFDLASLRLLPLQSNPNSVSAVVGGQADAALVPVTFVVPSLQRGDARLLAWVGDEAPWQLGAVFTATKTADTRRDAVERFLRAYKKGARDYHDAFTGANERREDRPTAAGTMAILAKYTGQSVDSVKLGIGYVDAEARLDVKDVLHQIAWYKAHAMLKGPADGDAVIDRRYVVPLPDP